MVTTCYCLFIFILPVRWERVSLLNHLFGTLDDVTVDCTLTVCVLVVALNFQVSLTKKVWLVFYKLLCSYIVK